MKGHVLARLAAGFFIQLLFYVLSFSVGYMVLLFLGAILTAAALGLLQGFLVAVGVAALGFAMDNPRFFMLPVDFFVIFAAAYGARHGIFLRFGRTVVYGFAVGFFAGVFGYALGTALQYPLAPLTPFAPPAWLTAEQGGVLFSGLYHAFDVTLSFVIVAALVRFAPQLFLAPMEADAQMPEHVRRVPLRWKLLVYMSLVPFTAGCSFSSCATSTARR